MARVNKPPIDVDSFKDRKWRQSLVRQGEVNESLTKPSYVTLGPDGNLLSERVLTASSNISVSDGGAGGAVTLDLTNSGVSAGSYTNTNITVDSKGRIISASNGAGGSIIWGSITGTLSSQTDLQTALNAKEPTITAGTTAQYWRGDKSWQTLNQAAVSGLTTASSPTFAGITLSGISSNRVLYTTTGGAVTSSANITFDGTKLNVGAGSNTASLEVQRADNTNYAVHLENAGGFGRVLKLKSGSFLGGQKIFSVSNSAAEIFYVQDSGGPLTAWTVADNTYYAVQITNSGGTGKCLSLDTGSYGAQGVLQLSVAGAPLFRVNSNGNPAYMDVNIADNTNYVTQYSNTGGTGRILKLVSAASSSSVPIIDAYGSTSSQVFFVGANGIVKSSSLATGSTPPTTTGTTKMVITDANGQLSFDNIPSGGGGGGTFGQATVDFGTSGNEPDTKVLSISAASITSTSKPVVSLAIDTASRDADELEMESFSVQVGAITNGVGFDVYINNLTGGAEGQYLINYSF